MVLVPTMKYIASKNELILTCLEKNLISRVEEVDFEV